MFFKSKFTDEELKEIDDELMSTFNEDIINELIRIGKEKKCIDVDVNIFFNVDENVTHSYISQDLKYILCSDNYESIDYIPREDENYLTLLVITKINLNTNLYKSRNKWINKLAFKDHLHVLLENTTNLEWNLDPFISKMSYDEDEKKVYDLPLYTNDKTFESISFVFELLV